MKRLDYYTVQDHSISVWSSTYKHMILSNLFDSSSNQPTPTGHHALHCIKLYLFFPSTSVSPYSAASLVCHLFSAKKYFLSCLDSLLLVNPLTPLKSILISTMTIYLSSFITHLKFLFL